MLTETLVLDYVKRNLGHPLTNIEINDQEIIDYIKKYTTRFFSRYKPLVKYCVIDLDANPSLKISQSEIILPDFEYELMSIDSVYQTDKYIIFNYPINPIPMWGDLPDFIRDIQQSMTAYRYSIYNITFEFLRPNRLRIYPNSLLNESFFIIKGLFVNGIETIPEDYSRIFLDLALADIMTYLANMRSKYTTYQTPFGEINLNVDGLRTQAEEIRNRVMEELNGALPETVIVVV